MKIQILGTGCAKCQALTKATEAAAQSLSLSDYTLEKVTDVADISSFGVMMTPALAIDGAVVVSGRVPTSNEIAKMIQTKSTN